MASNEETFTPEEVNQAMLEMPLPEQGFWQRVGQATLHIGKRFKIEQSGQDQTEVVGTVVSVEDDSATVIIDGQEETSTLNTRRLTATKEYVAKHRKEGAIITSAITVSLAGLYVWNRSRKYR